MIFKNWDLFEALEEALLKAEDMVKQVTKTQPDDQRAVLIAEVIDGCIEGITQLGVTLHLQFGIVA